ncbi:MAG: hypothetical protein WBL65_03725 [Bryobacteraceae bacterium]
MPKPASMTVPAASSPNIPGLGDAAGAPYTPGRLPEWKPGR